MQHNVLCESEYWQSEKQHEIKRNETFVRIWRKALAMAARTIKDWGDPESKLEPDENGIYKDILLNKEILKEEVYLKCRDQDKARLLFNNEHIARHEFEFFKIARSAINGLRNEAFHFRVKNSTSFIKNKLNNEKIDNNHLDTLKKFWNDDELKLNQQYAEIMEGAHMGSYFSKEENKKILNAALKSKDANLQLPRFNRIVEHANNNKMKNSLNLPKKVNQNNFKENKFEQCKYIAMKLLYEGPFKDWLQTQDTAKLNSYIKQSMKHMTIQVQNINRNSNVPDCMKKAKAERVGLLREGETIENFFFRLSAYMASEMNTQKSYGINKEEAKEQAAYIEKLKSNVIILAFEEFIKNEGFGFTTKLNKDSEESKANTITQIKDEITTTNSSNDEEDIWKYLLYFSIHLIPVEYANELLQQLYKLERLSGKETKDNKDLIHILKKYIQLHDARFSGNSIGDNIDKSELGKLFEKPYLIDKIKGNSPDNCMTSVRSLREIKRFGYFTPLLTIYKKYKIEEKLLHEYKKFIDDSVNQKTIDEYQKEKEQLHKKWVKNKKLPRAEEERYKKCVEKISEYKDLSHHLNMQNHVKLGKLLIAVLSRLIDYATIWERDLYFITLALIYTNDIDVSNIKKLSQLLKRRSEGDLFKAIEATAKYSPDFAREIAEYMDLDIENVEKSKPAFIRNDLAHFNIFDNPKDCNKKDINLTDAINDTRLMMVYDRKLKNAVAKSIKDLLEKEGIIVDWKVISHKLQNIKIDSKQIKHLGGREEITEDMHSNHYIDMVSIMFGYDRKVLRLDELKKS